MTFKTIGELAYKHRGETAWLFGKGPSLDHFDLSQAGPLRICINESALIVDDPTFFFAHDETPIKNVSGEFSHDCVAVLEISRARLAEKLGIPKNNIYLYQKEPILFFDSLASINEIAASSSLVGANGTAHSAIHFCKLIGVKCVKLIGFEGEGPYAPSLNMEVPLGGGRHAQIRSESICLLEMAGLEFEFLDGTGSSSVERPFGYDDLYDKLRIHGYHREDDETSHLAQHIPWLTEHLDFKSVLDIGCSTGKSLELFDQRGIEATGVEVSEIAVDHAQSLERNVVLGSAVDLPFADNSFDLVCSADVFEHLRPEDAGQACREACRVARRFVFLKIAEQEDVTQKWKDIAGHPLHLTSEPIQWWKQWCQPFGDIIRMEPELICLKLPGTTVTDN